jgi:hypothetical protein
VQRLNRSREFSGRFTRHQRTEQDYKVSRGAGCKISISSSSSDRTGDRGGAVADPAKLPVTRRPGARLGLGERRGVDGNQVGALTDMEDGGEQLKSGDGREVAVGRLGPRRCLAPMVFRRWKRGGGAAARRAGPYGGDGLLQSALTAANRAAAGGELGGRLGSQVRRRSGTSSGDAGAQGQGSRVPPL